MNPQDAFLFTFPRTTALVLYLGRQVSIRNIHSHKMPKRKNTVTSSFGSPGREGHDSSAFYKTRLYADRIQVESEAYSENPIVEIDVIFNSSCEEMKEL